jgi:transposase InsO family protein
VPFGEKSIMSQRQELAALMRQPGANKRELCRRFGVSPTTAYTWEGRYDADVGLDSVADRSRRPKHSPNRTSPAIEAAVLRVRAEHPAWGGRKLADALRTEGMAEVPAPSTITEILRRHGLLSGPKANQPRDWQRFEHPEPNDLWQMDFKGHFATDAGRCHPLTMLDDHSRYNLALYACTNERTTTVRPLLETTFRHYGLPKRILCDNGPPWGDSPEDRYTPLTVWLIQLGISVSHGRPYHPQTQGKLERFHRTLKAEVIGSRQLGNHDLCQRAFDSWRPIYNHKRPHEGIGMATPASRYRMSPHCFPDKLAAFDYGADAIVRSVQKHGVLSYDARRIRLPRAFAGHRVALRPTLTDGIYDVVFCHQLIETIDLRHADRA